MNKEQLSEWIYNRIIEKKSIDRFVSDKFSSNIYTLMGNSEFDFEIKKDELEAIVINYLK